MLVSKACSVFLLLVVIFAGGSKGSEADPSENATLVEETPKQTYKEAEKEVTDFVNDQLRALLPKLVGGAGANALSQKCTAGMMKIFGSVRKLKGWSLKILDSMGKPSSGILKGTFFSLGHYDQCVDLMVTSRGNEANNISEAMFQGMYCKIRLQFTDPIVEAARDYNRGELNASDLGKLREIIQATPYVPLTSEFMSHFIGICLPSICTVEDVQQTLHLLSFPGLATVERCEIKSQNGNMDETQMIVMIIFFLLVCFVCVSTLIDWLMHNRNHNASSSMENDKRCVSVTVSFSFCNNNRRLFKNIEDDADSGLANNCVRGVIVASVAWIVLGHTYLLPYDFFYMQSSSVENLRNYLTEDYFSYVVNYPLAIDSLFVCYGFILTYTLWYASCKAQHVQVNVFSLIIQNYLRIFIPVLLCLGVAIALPVFGSGPFWNDFADDSLTKCYKNTWAYVGMFSNFLNQDEQCLPHLWFASCLAQLTLVGIILCWILSKSMRFGVILTVLLALAGNITVGVYTYNNAFEPSYVAYFTENASDSFWKLNFSLPLSHFAPYALGLLTGIVVARRSKKPLKPILATIGWILCVCVLEGIMLFIYKYHLDPMGAVWSALYACVHRTLFALCVAWVILACSFGNGGFVNALFSWRIFDPLFRISYYAYIFHFLIIAFTTAASREHFHYSHLDLMMKTLSYIAASYIVSYFLYMILEMPLKSFCHALCHKKTSRITVTSLNNINGHKMDNLTPNSTIEGSCKLWYISNNKASVGTINI